MPLQLRLTPEIALAFAQGTGMRRVFDKLDESATVRVRDGYLRLLRERGVDLLDAGSLIGTGSRP